LSKIYETHKKSLPMIKLIYNRYTNVNKILCVTITKSLAIIGVKVPLAILGRTIEKIKMHCRKTIKKNSSLVILVSRRKSDLSIKRSKTLFSLHSKY
jgi:hypothetical protein